MVILVDASVWTEHLRRTRSRAHLEFRELVTTDPGIALRNGGSLWYRDQEYLRIAEVSGLEQRVLR